MQIYWNKRSVYIRQELNSHRIGLVHQHVRCLVVLQRQYGFHFVMCLRAIPYSGVLFAFLLLKFTIISNLLTKEMTGPDIFIYSWFIF